MSKIAVLIPHYNCVTDLERSLESISSLEQVDVIIVDDGSETKPNLDYLRDKYKHNINRIDLILSPSNVGIENALNMGLKHIVAAGKYEYVARLDCGDICVPTRFVIQKNYLDKNLDIYLVGSWISCIDLAGNELYVIKFPCNDKEIKRKMYLGCMFCHPSVMFRVKAIEELGYYPTNYKYAEDYAYFFKFTQRFKTANINEILLKYEINPNGISLSKRNKQFKNRIGIIFDNINIQYSSFAILGILKALLVVCLGNQVSQKIKSIVFARKKNT